MSRRHPLRSAGAYIALALCLPFGVRAQNASAEEALFYEAQAASRAKDYARAEKLYREVLARDPDVLAARVNLGLACYWQHKSRETLRELGKALESSPGEFSALLFSGLAYIDLTEYDSAQTVLDRARQVNGKDPLLLWALGSIAMIHSDAAGAIPLLEGCAALDPANVRCVWLLGTAYATVAYSERQNPAVRAEYSLKSDHAVQWMEERRPGSALLHVFKGDVLAARKATEGALREYQQALAIDPAWPDIHLLIGSLLRLTGRHDEARAELAIQLRQHPGDSRAMVEMGSAYYDSARYAEAAPFLKQALDRDTRSYDANYKLGRCYLASGSPASAIPLLERATALRPDDASPYYLLFRAYRSLNEPEKAAGALARFKRLKSSGS